MMMMKQKLSANKIDGRRSSPCFDFEKLGTAALKHLGIAEELGRG